VLTADDIVARLVDAGMACTVRRVIAARRAGILACTRHGRAVVSSEEAVDAWADAGCPAPAYQPQATYAPREESSEAERLQARLRTMTTPAIAAWVLRLQARESAAIGECVALRSDLRAARLEAAAESGRCAELEARLAVGEGRLRRQGGGSIP